MDYNGRSVWATAAVAIHTVETGARWGPVSLAGYPRGYDPLLKPVPARRMGFWRGMNQPEPVRWIGGAWGWRSKHPAPPNTSAACFFGRMLGGV